MPIENFMTIELLHREDGLWVVRVDGDLVKGIVESEGLEGYSQGVCVANVISAVMKATTKFVIKETGDDY